MALDKYRVGMIGVGGMGAGFADYRGFGMGCSGVVGVSAAMDKGGEGKEDWRQPISTITPESHAEAYLAHPKTELVAGCDVNVEVLEVFGRRYGVKNLYTDHREMLEKEGLDIVGITTNTLPRPEITIDVAETPGVKGIYTEKPMATTLEEADRMVEVCARRGVTLVVGAITVGHPSFRAARELIERGEIGKLKSAISPLWSAQHNSLIYVIGSEADWVFGVMRPRDNMSVRCNFTAAPLNPSHTYLCPRCGGTYCENHLPPAAHRCLGSEESLRAWWDDCDSEINQNRGIIHFKNGVDCYVGVGEAGASFFCDGGIITWDWKQFRLWNKIDASRWARNSLVELPWPQPQFSTPYVIHGLDDLIRCIEKGGEPRVSGRRVRDAMEIEIALRESHKAGNIKLKLPLKDRKFRLTYRPRR